MKLTSKDFNGIYGELFEIFGEDVTKTIHKNFSGLQYHFPQHMYSYIYVAKYIKANHQKVNTKDIARHLEYTERWVAKIKKLVLSKEEIGIDGLIKEINRLEEDSNINNEEN